MARVLITGSTDGLGLMAARLLVDGGHDVTFHARSAARAADLASVTGTRDVAGQANRLGRYDAVIHNAGIGYRQPRRIVTPDGLASVFAVNVLAPYLLTALLTVPARLVWPAGQRARLR